MLARWLELRRERRAKRRATSREIFLLRTPSGARWIDPIPAAEALEAKLGPDWPRLAAKLFGAVPVAPPGMPPESVANVVKADREAKDEAGKRLADAVCECLGVEPLTAGGEGMTRAERIAVAIEFVVFLMEAGRAARPFQPSPSPTA